MQRLLSYLTVTVLSNKNSPIIQRQSQKTIFKKATYNANDDIHQSRFTN